MQNFEYFNPTKVIFGKGTIAQLSQLIDKKEKILMTYGGGSIKKNGVYNQIKTALQGYDVIEFSGIEANPEYETCMKAVEICRKENITFILAVGGGSVLDGSKFIAAATKYEGDAWNILTSRGAFDKALPVASVLTIPATGSESNPNAVISREEKSDKLAFANPLSFPVFSILDPEVTYSLPERQVINGVVDSFVHVCEQYTSNYMNAELHDQLCEGVLRTLVKIGRDVIDNPTNYDLKAELMYCANVALNTSLGCGAPQDWSTHMIGHEITALYGVDHARSLAIILPGLLRKMKEDKSPKLDRFARNVFEKNTAEEGIVAIENFFRSLGMKTRFSEYEIDANEVAEKISGKFKSHNIVLGENSNITPEMVAEIIKDRA